LINEIWFITGQSGLEPGCYTVVENVVKPTYVGQWNGTASGIGGSESPYDICLQCINDEHSCPSEVSQTPAPTNTPTPTRTPTVTPTRTPTVTPSVSITKSPTPTRTVTPTKTKTPTPTPTPTSACACVGGTSQSITVYENIAAPSGSALYDNISEWYSYIQPCNTGGAGGSPYIVSSVPPLSLQTESHVSDPYPTRSYSYMISFKYVQVSAPSSNIRIAVGTGLQGDCKYGVFNIPSPVNGTWYTLRVDISNIATFGNEIRCSISTPIYSSYNYCTNPGLNSCCSVTATGTGTFPTCPTITNGCIIANEIGGYWCPW